MLKHRPRSASALQYMIALICIVGAHLVSPSTHAAISLDQVGYMGYSTDFAALSGNTAYVTVGDELHALDVTNPADVALLGKCSLLDSTGATVGKIVGLELSGSALYVLRDNGSVALQVVTIDAPSTPVLRGSYSPPLSTPGFEQTTSGRSMAVEGSMVYIGVRTHGVYAVNCANPDAPVQVSSYDLSPGLNALTPEVLDIASTGTRVFIMASSPNAVFSVDFSSLASPLLLGGTTSVNAQKKIRATESNVIIYDSAVQILDATLPATLPQVSAPGLSAQSLIIEGTQAFAANLLQITTIDLTNAASPSLQGSIALSGLAFVGKSDLAAGLGKLLVARGSDLSIVDVTNLAAPLFVGSYSRHVIGEPLQAPIISNGRMYMVTDISPYTSAGRTAIWVLLPVTGSTPILLGSIELSDSNLPNEVAVSNDIIYAVTNTGLLVFDATNPQSVNQIGSQTHPGANAFGRTIAVSGTMVYTGGNDGVNIYNANNPSSIQTVGQYVGVFPNIIPVFDLKFSGGLLYCAAGTQGLQILNVGNPSIPLLVSIGNVGGSNIREVQLSGTDCYARSSNALLKVDVSDPFAPSLEGTLALPGSASLLECVTCSENFKGSFGIAGNAAYVAAGLDGLYVVNYSNAGTPVIEDSWDTRWLNFATLDGDEIFLAEDAFELPAPFEAGLRVANVPTISEEGEPEAPAGMITSRPAFPEDGARLELTAPAGSNYQWRINGVEVSDQAPRVTGTQSQTLVFDPVYEADEAVFTCVYDDGSKQVVETLPFQLTVYPALSIPASNGWSLLLGTLAMLAISLLLFRASTPRDRAD